MARQPGPAYVVLSNTTVARMVRAGNGPDKMDQSNHPLSQAAADGLPALRVVLAGPRGFCAGVDRAIRVVEEALRRYGAPVYVRHEIVHNRTVVEELEAQGAVFVEELDEVPADAPRRVLRPRRAQIGPGRGRAAQPACISTRPARWSARCTARPSGTSPAAAPSSGTS